jgi:hypothetical protein
MHVAAVWHLGHALQQAWLPFPPDVHGYACNADGVKESHTALLLNPPTCMRIAHSALCMLLGTSSFAASASTA